eukprot:CAMPEP_0170492628 /NCGR_PEP_ID=MMETSP0208-20121228/12535_1 /TAXON_ID=197538 /ORGANISM="Strombidium inclinatum, Strain S3" /LENGTH=91 /DNA_ID=CAMNT_0010768401 /DNA_START=80 /DNA_END=355 /DNA_ORIENTATION=+
MKYLASRARRLSVRKLLELSSSFAALSSEDSRRLSAHSLTERGSMELPWLWVFFRSFCLGSSSDGSGPCGMDSAYSNTTRAASDRHTLFGE